MKPKGIWFKEGDLPTFSLRLLPEEWLKREWRDEDRSKKKEDFNSYFSALTLYHVTKEGEIKPLAKMNYDLDTTTGIATISSPVPGFSYYFVIQDILPPNLVSLSKDEQEFEQILINDRKALTNTSSLFLKGTSEKDSLVEIFNNEAKIAAFKNKDVEFTLPLTLNEGNNTLKASATRFLGEFHKKSGFSDNLIITLDTKEPNLELFPFTKNPFDIIIDKETSLEYILSEVADITIKVYDKDGQEVLTKEIKRHAAGKDIFIWNGRDKEEKEVLQGTYTFKVLATDLVGNKSKTQIQTVKIEENYPLYVKFITPSKDTFVISKLFPIKWRADVGMGKDKIKIDLYYQIQKLETKDESWQELARDLSNNGEYIWDTYYLPEEEIYRLKIVAKVLEGTKVDKKAEAVSKSFMIDNDYVPEIDIIYPKEDSCVNSNPDISLGESLPRISWNLSDRDNDFIQCSFYLSDDRGLNWKRILPSKIFLPGKYDLKYPIDHFSESNQALIKIVAYDDKNTTTIHTPLFTLGHLLDSNYRIIHKEGDLSLIFPENSVDQKVRIISHTLDDIKRIDSLKYDNMKKITNISVIPDTLRRLLVYKENNEKYPRFHNLVTLKQY
ncbi:MAG: FlgD immunoglobulin-like domain containing protein, partial [bacterium]|nr:FlgD immunoglobulin-like domain containing protein [bacterium]